MAAVACGLLLFLLLTSSLPPSSWPMPRRLAGFFPVVFFGAASGCDIPPHSEEGASCGPNAYYDEAAGPNMWEYYFEQPGGLSLEEINR